MTDTKKEEPYYGDHGVFREERPSLRFGYGACGIEPLSGA